MNGKQQEWDKAGPNSSRSANLASDAGKDSSPNSAENKMLSDILDNLRVDTYSHKVNQVPPYVLDKLSQIRDTEKTDTPENKSKYSSDEQQENRTQSLSHKKGDDSQYKSFADDVFVSSMDNNWGALLEAFRQKTAYVPGTERFEEDFNEKNYDLPWGGGERLRNALDGTANDNMEEPRNDNFKNFFSSGKAKNSNRNLKDEKYNNRSQRNYYMSTQRKSYLDTAVHRIFVVSPLFPLFLRIFMIIFCVIALSLASSIFVLSERAYDGRKVNQQASTIMAIVVQCFAITYLVYIAYDEYSGKPLGLRNPLGKMKLIMLDLLFIIFSSANLALAFNTLDDDRWVCLGSGRSSIYASFEVDSICRRQRGLVSFLLVATFLWVTAFTISIIRVVERVSVDGRPGVNV